MFHLEFQVNSFDEIVLYRYRFSCKDKVKNPEIGIYSEQIKIRHGMVLRLTCVRSMKLF